MILPSPILLVVLLHFLLPLAQSSKCPSNICTNRDHAHQLCFSYQSCVPIACTCTHPNGYSGLGYSCTTTHHNPPTSPPPTPSAPTLCPNTCISMFTAAKDCAQFPHCETISCQRIVQGRIRLGKTCTERRATTEPPTATVTATPSQQKISAPWTSMHPTMPSMPLPLLDSRTQPALAVSPNPSPSPMSSASMTPPMSPTPAASTQAEESPVPIVLAHMSMSPSPSVSTISSVSSIPVPLINPGILPTVPNTLPLFISPMISAPMASTTSPTPSASFPSSIAPTLSPLSMGARISAEPSVSIYPSISPTPSVSTSFGSNISRLPSTSMSPTPYISKSPTPSAPMQWGFSVSPSASATTSISMRITESPTPSGSISATASASMVPSATPTTSVSPSVSPKCSCGETQFLVAGYPYCVCGDDPCDACPDGSTCAMRENSDGSETMFCRKCDCGFCDSGADVCCEANANGVNCKPGAGRTTECQLRDFNLGLTPAGSSVNSNVCAGEEKTSSDVGDDLISACGCVPSRSELCQLPDRLDPVANCFIGRI